MLENFKKFEINKKEQKEISGAAIVPNAKACVTSTKLYATGSLWATVGMWVHC
ncbi:hypothetical protein [Tenacibaculum sp. nBUS_03]|uniref:hypothetical protein n=1 Tax=Tenacibaculum sp. nBUS_03 TaxID=3395320 RepID=UPI003EC09AB4